jgi:hypothetical protein
MLDGVNRGRIQDPIVQPARVMYRARTSGTAANNIGMIIPSVHLVICAAFVHSDQSPLNTVPKADAVIDCCCSRLYHCDTMLQQHIDCQTQAR